MPHYRPEPPQRVGPHSAVLLVNLGTPEAPTAPALRRYLRQFLSDPRVVEIPPLFWWPILHGIILTVRPAKSARKYAQVWTPDGSPLKFHTERQARLLKGLVGERGYTGIEVAWAMRYGAPSISDQLDFLKAEGCKQIFIVPLYPQYAASTTASVMDDVTAWMRTCRNLPQIDYIRDYHDHPRYIAALATTVREHWERNGRGDKLLMSFHGLPQRSTELGDPYQSECLNTARLLAAKLDLPNDGYIVTFQSRFGPSKWIQPYTQGTLEQLARDGLKKVDVICPGFVSDCLETLEEIAMECRDAFLACGGTDFNYIPCLNEHPAWIAALADIVGARLNGGD